MSIQENLSTFATAIGNAIKPFKFIPAKPAEAGSYDLAVDAQGQASWVAPAQPAVKLAYGGSYASSNMAGLKRDSRIIFPTKNEINGLDTILMDPTTGAINLEAGKTYQLSFNLNISSVAGGTFFSVGYGTPVGSSHTPLRTFYYSQFSAGGNVSNQIIYTPANNMTVYLAVIQAVNTTATFAVSAGSTASFLQIA